MEEYNLFCELIRVSIGRASRLSVSPSSDQWKQLYEYAMKQTLIGVCFAGVKRLKEQGVEVPQSLFMTWLSQAVFIKERNEKMNRWSASLCQKINDEAFDCCVLKGQSLAALYTGELSMLRQSGDIDIWMLASHKEVIRWGQENGGIWYYDYHHADYIGMQSVEVELHYRPTLSRNLLRNARLQRWIRKEGVALIAKSETNFPMPSKLFNLILVLNHNFWHLLYEGVGLRQTMDLYYTLLHNDYRKDEVQSLLQYFGLDKFAAANMWVLQELFALPAEKMVVTPNDEAGRHLLHEIMQAGNFGHYDKRLMQNRYRNRIWLMAGWMKHNFRLFRYYPADVLWSPLGVLYISMWRRWHYLIDGVKLNKKI